MKYRYIVSHTLFKDDDGGTLNVYNGSQLISSVTISGKEVLELKDNANKIISKIENVRGYINHG